MKEGLDWCTVVWQVAGSSEVGGFSDYMPLLVAVLAGCFTVLTVIFTRVFQDWKDKRSVRASLLAEVSGMRDMVNLRGYISSLRRTADELKGDSGDKIRNEGNVKKYRVKVNSDYNQIYKANLSRLGVLSETDASAIVQFHLLVSSVRADVIDGGLLYEGTDDPKAFDNTADLLAQALVLAGSLLLRRTTWWRRQAAKMWTFCGH